MIIVKIFGHILSLFVMQNLDFMRTTPVQGFSCTNNALMSAEHDDFFIFADDQSEIRTFDLATKVITQLPPPDKKIRGRVVAVDFSPSRQYAAASYSDGGIQLFDLDMNKAVKMLVKPHDMFAVSLVFASDSTLLVAEGGNITGFKITQTLGFTTVKEFSVAQIQDMILEIVIPPVYHYTGKDQCKSVSPQFEDVLAVCTTSGIQCVRLTPDMKLSTLAKVATPSAIATFALVNPTTLYMAVGSENKIEIYKFTDGYEVISSSKVDMTPVHMAFMSSTILMAFDVSFEGVMVSFADNVTVQVKCPINSGCFVFGNYKFFVFSDLKLWELTLQTFNEKMEELKEAGEYEKALTLCRRAIEGDHTAIIGLSSNKAQRALVIEKSLSDVLVETTQKQLKTSGVDVSAVAKSVVKLSKELNIEDWIVNQAVSIFEDHNGLKELMKEVILGDPTAAIFSYTPQFAAKLFEIRPDFDITEFAVNLPMKVASIAMLLSYAKETKNYDMLAEVYFRRLNNVGAGMTILANVGRYDQICDYIMKNASRIEESIKWIFSRDSNGFPFVPQILKTDKVEQVLERVGKYVEKNNKPLTYADYINIMVQCLGTADMMNSPIMVNVENVILQKKVKLNASTMKVLLKRVFTNNVPNPDNREKMLLYILTCDVPVSFKESLMQLCASFGFTRAKEQIQKAAKNYEGTIKEMINAGKSDVFAFMKSLVMKDREAIVSIKRAIVSNTSILAARDVENLAQFCTEFLGDSLLSIINEVQEETVQNVFIRQILRSYKYKDLVLPSDLTLRFCRFLCRHYPSEVRDFVSRRRDYVDKFIVPCEDYKLYDACAVIYNIMDDLDRSGQYICKYIQTELIFYAEGKQTTDIDAMAEFITEFVNTVLKDRSISDSIISFCKAVINAFALPFHALEKRKLEGENTDTIIEVFKKLCVAVANVITFPSLLEMIVVEFQEINFKYARNAVLAIMNDYDYDVDQNLTMSLLFQQDEGEAHSRYIKDLVHGVRYTNMECLSCHHSIFGSSAAVKIFPCGHAFHRTPTCLKREVCPVCNLEASIEEGSAPAARPMPPARFRRELARFEYMLSKQNKRGDETKCGNISIPEIMDFPL